MSSFLRKGIRSLVGAAGTPASGSRALYPLSTGWYELDSSGIQRKVTSDFLDNSSVAQAFISSGADTYLNGSAITLDPLRFKAGTYYRYTADIVKTAAGVATAQYVLRLGTGAVTDTAICTLPFAAAATAVVDNGKVEILATFRSVGSGTSAVVAATLFLTHANANTGFVSSGTQFMIPAKVTSSGFNSTTPSNPATLGLSVNPGASSTWTITTQVAELGNLG